MLNMNTLLNNIAKLKILKANIASNNVTKTTAYNRKLQVINKSL